MNFCSNLGYIILIFKKVSFVIIMEFFFFKNRQINLYYMKKLLRKTKLITVVNILFLTCLRNKIQRLNSYKFLYKYKIIT